MKIPPFISQPLPPSPQGAPYPQHKQVVRLAPHGSRDDVPCGCRAEPAIIADRRTRTLKASRTACALLPKAIPAARQSPPQGASHPNTSKSPGLRLRVKGRCPLRVQGGARNYRRQAHPNLKSKPNGLRLIAESNPRRKAIPAARRIPPQHKQVARLAPTGQGTMSLAGAGRSPQLSPTGAPEP